MKQTTVKEKKQVKSQAVKPAAQAILPQAPLPSPELRTPKDIMLVMGDVSDKRTHRRPFAMFLEGLLAGILIGIACIATCSATFMLGNASAIKIATALLFPFGLISIVFSGGELFTGNILIIIGVLEKRAKVAGMLCNLMWVYLGNLAGTLLMVFSFQSSYLLGSGDGALAVNFIQLASTKTSIAWGDAFMLGIYCNILVTLAILFASGARDPMGKIFGGLIPVSLFVMSGFEHCVANMFYIPMGVLASENAAYASLAVEKGINISSLSMMNFVTNNLIPVTLGNAVGGLLLGLLMWYCHQGKGGDYFDGPASH